MGWGWANGRLPPALRAAGLRPARPSCGKRTRPRWCPPPLSSSISAGMATPWLHLQGCRNEGACRFV
ncbi:hypothetical protein DL1_09280 [Thioclava dalianensis]|uniref:Uncharacterized protein n=1 Tax=Thioclava dalianensis TaxID=1185766 RepID=A0A074TAE4_9RHOB|nr:hypothetical protein DL1_09280 [Thioclava dalianensis]